MESNPQASQTVACVASQRAVQCAATPATQGGLGDESDPQTVHPSAGGFGGVEAGGGDRLHTTGGRGFTAVVVGELGAFPARGDTDR